MTANIFAMAVSLGASVALFVLSGRTRLMHRGLLLVAMGVLLAVGVHSVVEYLEKVGILGVDHLLAVMPMLVSLGSVFIGIGGVSIYRKVTKPLNRFMAELKTMDFRANDIQREFRAQSEADNELGQLARAIISLITRLSESREMLERHNLELEREVSMRVSEHVALSNQLFAAQKMESVGRLAAGIAHEINTPAQFVGDNNSFLKNSFKALLSLLEKYRTLQLVFEKAGVDPVLSQDLEHATAEADLDYLMEEIPKAIDQSLEGLQRVSKIVTAMKDFSHPGAAEKEMTDINHAIETTVTVARNEWKHKADMELQLDPGLPPISCLAGEINQVFLNLIVNAAHAVEATGVRESGEKGLIRISTRRDGDAVEIRISDTGAGIAPEHRGRIFEPFFTTKGVGKGTGQGLALAYQTVVKKHGGTIRFETETGKGTTFIVRLPLRVETTHQETV